MGMGRGTSFHDPYPYPDPCDGFGAYLGRCDAAVTLAQINTNCHDNANCHTSKRAWGGYGVQGGGVEDNRDGRELNRRAQTTRYVIFFPFLIFIY